MLAPLVVIFVTIIQFDAVYLGIGCGMLSPVRRTIFLIWSFWDLMDSDGNPRGVGLDEKK